MPNEIFVGSLRDDQQVYAARIRARLANVLGASYDFMDGEQPARRPAPKVFVFPGAADDLAVPQSYSHRRGRKLHFLNGVSLLGDGGRSRSRARSRRRAHLELAQAGARD